MHYLCTSKTVFRCPPATKKGIQPALGQDASLHGLENTLSEAETEGVRSHHIISRQARDYP